MMACDTELSEVDNNLAEAIVSYCDIFMLASYLLRLILRRFFSTLVGVLTIFPL